jgi:hypothetical protein
VWEKGWVAGRDKSTRKIEAPSEFAPKTYGNCVILYVRPARPNPPISLQTSCQPGVIIVKYACLTTNCVSAEKACEIRDLWELSPSPLLGTFRRLSVPFLKAVTYSMSEAVSVRSSPDRFYSREFTARTGASPHQVLRLRILATWSHPQRRGPKPHCQEPHSHPAGGGCFQTQHEHGRPSRPL